MSEDQDIFDSTEYANFAEVVKRALSRGLIIHPVKPRGKEPWLLNWPKQASRDLEVIQEWCKRFPTSNYGVVANDEYCILESDDFGRFTSLLSNELPLTYTVQARPNRPHLYFRQTEASKAAGNLDSPGVFEFKQNNRYVVGEGSIHPTGVPYSETNPSDIVPIPDWLVTDLQAIRSGRTTKVSAPLPSPGEKLGEGEGRHPMLMSAAARLWDGQKTREEMLEDLESVNQAHCDPPKTSAHLLSCIDWVMAREPNQAAPAVEIGSVWGITVPAALDYVKEHKIDRAPLLVQGTRGVVLYEKSLNQIVAERGLGKTLFALGLAGCLSTGTSILDYQATKACRVVFVDGELPFEQLCERAASFCLSENVVLINPEHITPKGPIRLLKRESKFAYAETPAVDKLKRALKHHKADVLILDSQSTLMGTDSLSMEFQETRMNFLRDLRTEGYCVIEMHHTGKQGLQRGSSVNDDILDLQFILKRCDDWSPGQKLQFELTIGKLRHAADLEEEFVVTLDANGKWTKRTSDTETGVLELLREGKSISVVAKDMGLHPSSVKRLRKKLQQKGLLELNEKTK